MNFAFSEEQEELRATLRRFLAERAPIGEVRRLIETPAAHDAGVWKQMAGELGLQGVAIEEACGGQGFGFLELGLVQEELGRALSPEPFFASVCLAARAIAHAGAGAEGAALLRAIASGDEIATLARVDESVERLAVECRPAGDTFTLHGIEPVVLDAARADRLVVAARLPGTTGRAGITLLHLAASSPGVAITSLEPLDPTRPIARVAFDGARARALGAPGGAALALGRALDEAAIALAFEMIGGAERCLEMAVAYAKERIQFSRPIGSFQAIQHRCAETLLEIELAKSTVHWAGWLASRAETSDAERGHAADLARATAIDAFSRAAAENLHVHGGVGFTWEYDPQLYFKRAKACELLFGDGVRRRERIAQALLAS